MDYEKLRVGQKLSDETGYEYKVIGKTQKDIILKITNNILGPTTHNKGDFVKIPRLK